jgi:hypothetical protein
MDKSMNNWWAHALEFVGSVLLLFVALELVSGGLTFMGSGIWSIGGGMWLPFFVGIATVSSLVLFFLSFASLTPAGQCDCGCGCCCGCGGGRKIKIAALASGISLVALTVGQSQMLVIVLLGFALTYIGTLVSSTCTCEMEVAPAKPKSKR